MKSEKRAFSLVELLVAVVLLMLIVGVVFQLTNQTSRVWRDSAQKIQAFQEARAAFEALTRKLELATLNTYYDYYQNATPRSQLPATALADFTPTSYDRVSDLHFISGQSAILLKNSPTPVTTQTQAVFFQALLGYSTKYAALAGAMNACGYYLSFDDAAGGVPDHVRNSPGYKPRYRYRLMEMMQGTESFQGYYNGGDLNGWFVKNAAANSRVIAENVIALVLLPKLQPSRDDPNGPSKGVSLAPRYNYNSRIALGAGGDPSWAGFPPDAFTAYNVSGSAVAGTRHHQLPPLMQVVMVVIDEVSAMHLQGASTAVPAGIDLSRTALFTDAAKLAADIQSVEDICDAKDGNLTGNTVRLNYIVLNTDIQIREAKSSNK